MGNIKKLFNRFKRKARDLILLAVFVYIFILFLSVIVNLSNPRVAIELGDVGITVSVGILGLSILALPYSLDKMRVKGDRKFLLERQMQIIKAFTLVLISSVALIVSGYLPVAFRFGGDIGLDMTQSGLLMLSMMAFGYSLAGGLYSLHELVKDIQWYYNIPDDEE